jgi:hypothetical protein
MHMTDMHNTNETAPHGMSAEALEAADPVQMVNDVRDRITSHQEKLAETDGFDKDTGTPVPRLTGHKRHAMELELASLIEHSLPWQESRAAEVAQWKAALPTVHEKLAAELAKRERVEARALELAEEEEAKQMSKRIAKNQVRQLAS